MSGLRLDSALVERGLSTSRNRAAREIAAGNVLVDGSRIVKPAHRVDGTSRIELLAEDPWVARSAHKLLGAIDAFDLRPRIAGRICLDAGASTGGFTQVLLHHGARLVHAVDVGHDQLHPILRADARVHELSGHNLREMTPDWLGADQPVDLICADVSFISLTLLIAPLLGVLAAEGRMVLMVKPQFEAGRGALDKHGVVTDPRRRAQAVAQVAEAVCTAGGAVAGWAPSPLPGPAGNREYFLLVAPHSLGSQGEEPARIASAIVKEG